MSGLTKKTMRTKALAERKTKATIKNKKTKTPAPQLGVAVSDKVTDMVEIQCKTLDRLEEAIRRLLVAGSDSSGWLSDGVQTLSPLNDSPVPSSVPAKNRQQLEQLKGLVQDIIAGAVQQQQADKTEEGSADEEEEDNEEEKDENSPVWCSGKLQQLILDAGVFNQKQLQMNDDDGVHEDNQARCSGQPQLLFTQALLEQQQPQMDSKDQNDDDDDDDDAVTSSALLAADIILSMKQNTGGDKRDELMNRVSVEMHAILDCTCDLRQWIKLAKSQRILAREYGRSVLNGALTIIRSIEKISSNALLSRSDFLATRALHTKMALMSAFSDDQQKAFDAHEKLNTVTWSHHAMSLAGVCMRLLDYISKNLPLIKEPRPNEELTKAINLTKAISSEAPSSSI